MLQIHPNARTTRPSVPRSPAPPSPSAYWLDAMASVRILSASGAIDGLRIAWTTQPSPISYPGKDTRRTPMAWSSAPMCVWGAKRSASPPGPTRISRRCSGASMLHTTPAASASSTAELLTSSSQNASVSPVSSPMSDVLGRTISPKYARPLNAQRTSHNQRVSPQEH